MDLGEQRTVPQSAAWHVWTRCEQLGKQVWNRWAIHCAAPGCSGTGLPKLSVLAKYSGVSYNNLWYHEAECLRSALTVKLSQSLAGVGQERPRPYRLPLGLLLVTRGVISAEQLRAALREQKEAGHGKIGYWLQQRVPLAESQLTAALGQQWGCPVYRINNKSVFSPPQGYIPLPILTAAKGVPVHASIDGSQVHIAFAERVDHTLLYGVEEMLGCKTVACVASQSTIEEMLEAMQRAAAGYDICFDSTRDADEMAGTICSYALQMDARQIQTARAGAYLWVALRRKMARRDLLFRLPDKRAPEAALARERTKGFPDVAQARNYSVENQLSRA